MKEHSGDKQVKSPLGSEDPLRWLWEIQSVQPWIWDHSSQAFEFVLLFHLSRLLPRVQEKKSLLLFKISRPSPPLHFAQVQTTMKISPTQAIHPSLRTAHTNKQTPKTQEAYTVRNLHAYKQTGLLICSRVGGLSPKCRQDIAAVKGEIVQSYLPSTDQGGIPKTELTQLINLPHCCLSQLPSFQATCGIVIF